LPEPFDGPFSGSHSYLRRYTGSFLGGSLFSDRALVPYKFFSSRTINPLFIPGEPILCIRVNILGIAGSLRRASYDRATLGVGQRLAPYGAKLETLELDGIPGFKEDVERNPSAKVIRPKGCMRAADAILFATPGLNYSTPGVLTNSADRVSRYHEDNPWKCKPVVVMRAREGTPRTARGSYHLRRTFVFLKVYPLDQPGVMIGNAPERFDAARRLPDGKVKELSAGFCRICSCGDGSTTTAGDECLVTLTIPGRHSFISLVRSK
jgi:chromate reductase